MDAILSALNGWHQSTGFTESLGLLRLVFFGVLGLAVVIVQRDDLLADLRAAIAHAGMSDKQVAADMDISKGLCSLKLHGGRPLTVDAIAKLPVEVLQWFAVTLAHHVGLPKEVSTGARLARAQVRMTIRDRKAGAA